MDLLQALGDYYYYYLFIFRLESEMASSFYFEKIWRDKNEG